MGAAFFEGAKTPGEENPGWIWAFFVRFRAKKGE
jgi:hypothetical protein